MLKIIIKTIILVLIILSIYFIINPSACSNLINGRVVNAREELPALKPADKQNELLTPSSDQPLRTDAQPITQPSAPVEQAQVPHAQKPGVTFTTTQPVEEKSPAAGTLSPTNQAGITDTNSLQQPATPAAQTPAVQAPQRPQIEVDYAIASRYVELENKYLAQHKDVHNAAKDISYIVMDDFELTPAEWEAFLQRATAENLFEKVRAEQAKK